ncbi:transient-receptor-potential-like protein [Montipora capricornis]|uniref:transient-receptor-potential-like protein n=1 Tax=Montipora capricornis TaxID=246305 RepID=UPI0035F1E22A
MFHFFLEAVSHDVEAKPDDVNRCKWAEAILAKKGNVKECLSPTRPDIPAKTGRVVNDGKVKKGEKKRHSELLLDALNKDDPNEVLTLIVEGNEKKRKTLKTLNDNAKAIAQRERKRTACLCQCGQGCRDCSKEEIDASLDECCNKCLCSCCQNCNCCNCMQPCSRECGGKIRKVCRNWLCCPHIEQQSMENRSFNEEEREWIKILSNPLYISLEWFWRIYTKPGGNEAGKGNENEDKDVIVAALRDSHLLQTIAGNDIHQHKKEYEQAADEIQKFAVAVVEESTYEQLLNIMDTQGDGCLKQNKPENFSQSLSVLKIAADLERIKFVASDKCQTILNEVIYYGCPSWQKKSRTPKILWSIVQLLCFILIPIPLVYIFFRLCKEWCGVTCQKCRPDRGNGDGQRDCCVSCCCHSCDGFPLLFEHPYSKFVNHTVLYLVFLGFLIAASFEDEFGTTDSGVVWIDWVILGFLIGHVVQEFLAFWREGCFIYFSKWWNVVDTMIILLFGFAYATWGISYAYFGGQWKPEKTAFITADVLFSSGIILAFFHLTHIFQVDSVLGPLQLSLYKMLRDVWKFLLLFLLLYISFATGLTKMYSYYVASQIKLEQRNMTHYEKGHPYASHLNTGLDLFWLLLGVFDEGKISVEDPAFKAFSFFGHLFLIVYVVSMVIVALNMLIAMMNKSFETINEDSATWKFSRTRMWLESIDKGNVLPVPVNLIYYFFKILYIFFYVTVIKWLIKCISPRCRCCKKAGNQGQNHSEAHEAAQCTLPGASSTDVTELENQDEGKGKKYLKTDGAGNQGQNHSEAHEDRLTTMKRLVVKFLQKSYKKHPVSVGQRTRAQSI